MGKQQWMKLAAAVGFAARKLWRHPVPLASEELVILDLLVEALARMGNRGGPSGELAIIEVKSAPQVVQDLVKHLLPVASRAVVSPGQSMQDGAEADKKSTTMPHSLNEEGYALNSREKLERKVVEEKYKEVEECSGNETMEISAAAKSGDGTVINVGIKTEAAFPCPDCRQKFDTEKAKQMHWKFIHDPNRHQED